MNTKGTHMTDPMPAIRDILGMKTPILPAGIRKGDSLRAEYGTTDAPEAHEYIAQEDGDHWGPTRTHYLLKRPVPVVVLPTAIGYHADTDGSVWWRQSTGANNGHHWQDSDGERHNDEVARRFAPFKRLRDESEVAAEVCAEILAEFELVNLVSYQQDVREVAARWATK